MYEKVMNVFYGTDLLPYKDKERQVHYPITGNAFLGASNTTQIRFFIDLIGNYTDTWVANSKLPNGKLGNKVLSSGYDSEIGEHYVYLDLSSFYTQAKGDLYISLNGFVGGITITESGGQYSISGIPTIQATGVIKIAINYATPLIDGDEVETITLQQLLAIMGSKLPKNDNKYLKIVNGDMSIINTQAYKDYIFSGDIVFNFSNQVGVSNPNRFWLISGTYPNLTYTQITLKLSSVVIDTLETTNISIGNFANIVDENDQTLSQYIESQIEGNLDEKVDKINVANRVYGTDNSGNQTTIPIDSFYEGTIVRRDSDDSITVPLTPTQNGYATSKKYVDDLVSTVKANAYQVVSELPSVGEEGIIYLIETSSGSGVYNQYIWEGNDYVYLGRTQIDLSGYVPKTRTIVGIDLEDNITKNEFSDSLNDIGLLNSSNNPVRNNVISRTFEYYKKDLNRQTLSKNDYLYNLRKNTGSQTIEENEDGTRIRIVYALESPAYIDVVATAGAGMIVNSYDILGYAIDSNTGYEQEITGSSYTTSEVKEYVSSGKYLAISLKKVDGSSITDAERTELFNNLTVIIKPESDVSYTAEKCYKIKGKDDYLCKSLKSTSSGNYTPINDSSPNRLRVIYKVKKGEVVQLQNKDYLMWATTYNTLTNAFRASPSQENGRNQLLTLYDYVNTKVIAEILEDGYLCITMKNTDNSTISNEVAQKMFDSLYVDISPAETYFNELKLEKMYVSPLVQKASTASGYSDGTRRMTEDSTLALPKGSLRKIMVLVNSNYKLGIRTGKASTNLNHNQYWFNSGDLITIPDGDNYYRLTIADGLDPDNNNVDPTIDYKLKVFVENVDTLIDNECYKSVISARYDMTAPRTINNYPFILHTSDCHGDIERTKRFVKYAEALGADAACITGDVVSYDPSSGIKWFQDIVNETDSNVCVCLGNHDVYNNNYDDDDVYDYFFNDMATKLGISNNKTWYYKDISSKKIRIISINLYQYGGSNRWYSHFTEEQLNFLVSALSSTPNNYGIFIMAHDPQKQLSGAKDNNYPTFFQNNRLYDAPHVGVTGCPIYDIVDAFIQRTTLSKTYSQTGSPSSVSVSADFTNVNSSVEFIAHLTGHFHQDTICYVPDTLEKQLMLNVTCTNALYGGEDYPYLSDLSDLGRSKNGPSQDAFNAYVIDRTNKKVKVVRIGQTLIYDMSERKYMEIPYAD